MAGDIGIISCVEMQQIPMAGFALDGTGTLPIIFSLPLYQMLHQRHKKHTPFIITKEPIDL